MLHFQGTLATLKGLDGEGDSMAEQSGRGNPRGRGDRDAGRGSSGGSQSRASRPQSGDERRGSSNRSGGRAGAPSEGRRGSSAPSGAGRQDRGQSGARDRRDGPPRDRREDGPRSEDQRRYDGPDIPEHITGRELDRSVAAQLKSLPEKLGLRVARHLVAASEAIESNPKIAYEHTLAARARAGRLAIVREAVGEAAYAAGEYTEALAELRAARRMNGSAAYLAVMADCERALGRPDKALTLVRSAPRDRLSVEEQAELTIVEAGARRDRKEFAAALRTLEAAPLDSRSRAPWVARLRYVYADTLVDAGQLSDALVWFHRAEAVDSEGLTDAGARAAEVENRLRQN